MIEMKATVTCDRCLVSKIEMDNCDDEVEASMRISQHEIGWCESDDGEIVCPSCWAAWDAKQRSDSAPSADAVDPVAAHSHEPSTRD